VTFCDEDSDSLETRDYNVRFATALTSHDTGMQSKKMIFCKGSIRSEINGTTMIWHTYSSNALCSNYSNSQTGNGGVAPEARRYTRLHLLYLVKLQDFPNFRNHSMPLEICFHREYTELQTKIAPGKENTE